MSDSRSNFVRTSPSVVEHKSSWTCYVAACGGECFVEKIRAKAIDLRSYCEIPEIRPRHVLFMYVTLTTVHIGPEDLSNRKI